MTHRVRCTQCSKRIIKDMDSVITPLLAGGKSSLDGGATGDAFLGKDGIIPNVAKGAVNITKAGVGFASKLAGNAVRLVGGAAGAAGSGIGSRIQDIRANALRNMDENADRDTDEAHNQRFENSHKVYCNDFNTFCQVFSTK